MAGRLWKVGEKQEKMQIQTPAPDDDEDEDDDEEPVVVKKRINWDKWQDIGISASLLCAGGFIWHMVNPFIFQPPNHQATFAAIREKDGDAAEHIEEIAKAVKYDMPLSARLAYQDKVESHIAQASQVNTPTEEEDERKR